jgi:hypothetical protein
MAIDINNHVTDMIDATAMKFLSAETFQAVNVQPRWALYQSMARSSPSLKRTNGS